MRISDWSSDVCSSDLPRPQVAIITTPGRVAHRRPVHAEDRTRPTLADAEQLPSMLDSLPLSGGPHQFFAATSFSTALSSMASASSRLSRSEEHTSELQSLMRISYAVFCLKTNKKNP